MDWPVMQNYVKVDYVEPFWTALAAQLRTNNKQFGLLQKGLRQQCFNQVDAELARQFVCNCLIFALQTSASRDIAVAHLLLDTVPTASTTSKLARSAPKLLSCCCSVEYARLAVKVVHVFNVTWHDVEDQQACKELIQTLLKNRSFYTPATGLLLHFPELHQGTDISQILAALVEDGQLGLAQQWAETLPQAFQVELVDYCVHVDRLKEAVKLVRHLKLRQNYPDIDEMYKQRTLTRLLDKEQWEVAATYAGQDVRCQEQVIRAMAIAGEAARADELRQQLGLGPDVLGLDQGQIEAQRALAAESYLSLRLPTSSILFVDDEETLSRASHLLGSAKVVGLDVEWKPNTSGKQNPASLLQIAARSAVVLLDMLKLHQVEALDSCLTSLLHSSNVVKLGCRLSDDVSKLHSSYPHMQAFEQAVSLLDLTTPWTMYMQTHNRQALQGRRSGAPVGLSTMALAVLGKPLNKAMQMSDWERRPLSSRQMEYAALDAFVLLDIYDVIADPEKGLSRQQLESLAHNYAGQKRQRRSPEPRSNASDQQESLPETADVSTASKYVPSGSGTPADAAEGEQPVASTDTGVQAMQANSRQASVQSHSRQPHISQHTAAKGDDDSDGHGGHGGSLPVQQLHHKQADCTQLPHSAMEPMPAGLPLWGCLQRNGLQQAVKRTLPGTGTLATAASAAATLKVPQGRIANSLAVLASKASPAQSYTPIVLVLRGDQRADMRKAKSLFFQSRARFLPSCRQRCRLGFAPARWAARPARLSEGCWALQVADYIGCSRRALKAATPEQCHTIFGYPPGVLPPCGHACQALLLVDQGLQHYSQQQQPPAHGQQAFISGSTASAQPKPTADPLPQAIAHLAKPLQPASAVVNDLGMLCTPHGQAASQPQQTPQACSVDTDAEANTAHSPAQQDCVAESQAGSRAGLLYCGAGLPDAYLAVTFDELMLLSHGHAMDITQHASLSADQAAVSCNGWQQGAGSSSSHAERPAQQAVTANTAPCKFLLDSMCGRLCRWLRCVGVDTKLVDASIPRSTVAQLSSNASKDGRVFLTRDHKLAERHSASAVYFLAGDNAREQFRDIHKHFGIRADKKQLLSRCSQCNSARIHKVEPAAIQHAVEPKVLEYVSNFWQCQGCDKVFWVGPKSDAAIQNVLSLMHEEACTEQRLPS